MILSSLCHYWKLSVCRVPWTLPSALDQTGTRQTDCVPSAANKTLGKHMTLGKASLCRVLFPRHSAKPPFAEWHKPSTRQTIADTECHCCCTRQTVQALPSACRHGTRQSRVTVSWPFLLLFFLPRALSADKKHSANSALLSIWLPCDVCRGWHSQSLCRVHLDLCRNKANPVVSPYVYTLTHVSPRTNTPLVTKHRQTYTRIPITEILLTPS